MESKLFCIHLVATSIFIFLFFLVYTDSISNLCISNDIATFMRVIIIPFCPIFCCMSLSYL
jgi:hypothetical protein